MEIILCHDVQNVFVHNDTHDQILNQFQNFRQARRYRQTVEHFEMLVEILRHLFKGKSFWEVFLLCMQENTGALQRNGDEKNIELQRMVMKSQLSSLLFL